MQQGKVKNESEIEECFATECRGGLGTQDYVTCEAGKKYYKFEFDDICDSQNSVIEDVGNTYSGPGVFFGPGMK